MQEIERLQQIDKYIRGELTEHEIDLLWIEFLESPQWLEYLIIELTLLEYLNSGRNFLHS